MDNNSGSLSTAVPQPVSVVKKWAPLVVLSLAMMIIILDTTILNVSLKTIISDLKTDILSIQWVITAYSLIIASFMITGGRLGDLFGRKKMFVVGAVIFAVGSFIASISQNAATMIVGEAIIEGIGAALMLPATLALIISTYQGRDRQIGFGVWGAIAAASAAIGPVFGGWLTTYYSWRWAFRVNLFVAAILVIASVILKETRDDEHQPTLDIVGVVLSSLGLLSLVFGFIESSTYGWFKAKEALVISGHTILSSGTYIVPLFIAIGLLILGAFVWWEYHMQESGRTPLVSLKLFENTAFTVGSLIVMMLFLGQAGLFFAIPVFLQAVKNLDALHTGLAMLPLSLSILVAAPASAYISKFVTPKHLIQAGIILSALSFLVLRASLAVDVTNWGLAPGLILFGLGMGLMIAQGNGVALSTIPVSEAGEASGVNGTMRQVGATLGAAIMGAILISALGANLVSGVQNSTVIPAAMKSTLSTAVSQQSSNIEFGGTASVSGQNLPAPITAEISLIGRQSMVDANKTTLAYGVLFILLTFIVSFWLPETAKKEEGLPHASFNDPTEEVIPLRTARRRALGFIILTAMVATMIGYGVGREVTAGTLLPASALSVKNTLSNPVATAGRTSNPFPIDGDNGTSHVYADSTLHFRVQIPNDWQVTKNAEQTVFKTSAGQMYSVEVHDIHAANWSYNQSKNYVQNFLGRQKNIRNVTETSLGMYPAWHFDAEGEYGQGYVLIENGRFYEILGPEGSIFNLPEFVVL